MMSRSGQQTCFSSICSSKASASLVLKAHFDCGTNLNKRLIEHQYINTL